MDIIHQIDLSKFLNFGYIFESNPSSEGLYRYLLIIFGVEIIGAVIVYFFNRQKGIFKKLKNGFFSLFLTTGIIGLTIIFFRQQQIPYLGSRLLLVLLLVTFLIWLGFIIRYWLITLPKEIIQKKQKEKFEKYLPKNTKKGY